MKPEYCENNYCRYVAKMGKAAAEKKNPSIGYNVVGESPSFHCTNGKRFGYSNHSSG